MFGCIADKGYVIDPDNTDPDNLGATTCILDGSSACSFSTAIGVISFISALLFFIKDLAIVVMDYSNAISVSVCKWVIEMHRTGGKKRRGQEKGRGLCGTGLVKIMGVAKKGAGFVRDWAWLGQWVWFVWAWLW